MAEKTKRVKVDYEVIDRLSEKEGISQSDLGKKVGKSRSWYSIVKRQNSTLDDMTVRMLSLMLRVDMEELMLKEKPTTQEKPQDKDISVMGHLVMDVKEICSEEFENIENKLNTLNTRTAKTSQLIDVNLPELAKRVAELSESVAKMEHGICTGEFKFNPLDVCGAFLEGIFRGSDEVLESTVQQLAKAHGIDQETLKLAREEFEYSVIARSIGKSVYKFWRKR